MSKYDIFSNIINNELCYRALRYHDINILNFYEIIQQSAFNIDDVSRLISNIGNNTITQQNKYEFSLNYLMNFDEKSRECSMKCIKIILTMTDVYIRGTYRSDNPYYYLHMLISNIMMSYLIHDIQSTYNIDNFVNISLKFRLIILQNRWYRTSLNIYELLKIYLQHLNILQLENNVYEIDINNQSEVDNFMKSIVDYDRINEETIVCLTEFNLLLQLTTKCIEVILLYRT